MAIYKNIITYHQKNSLNKVFFKKMGIDSFQANPTYQDHRQCVDSQI